MTILKRNIGLIFIAKIEISVMQNEQKEAPKKHYSKYLNGFKN